MAPRKDVLLVKNLVVLEAEKSVSMKATIAVEQKVCLKESSMVALMDSYLEMMTASKLVELMA